MDTAIESFEREEFRAGDVVVHEGDLLNRLYVVKIGELSLVKNGVPAPPGTLKEALGFSYFGETSLEVRSGWHSFPLLHFCHALQLYAVGLASFATMMHCTAASLSKDLPWCWTVIV